MAEAFSLSRVVFSVSPERASVMTMYTEELVNSFSTALWAGSSRTPRWGKAIFPPDQKSIASEINFCGFGG